jgi:cytochrome c-type biogenesis protein CcmH
MRRRLALVLCFLWAGSALAAGIDQPMADTTQEDTARAIFHELRCVVCEGQSIAESNATLATQMRMHVREMLAEGKNKDEILASFRQSYGDSILLTPPLMAKTVLLWLAPLLLLLTGAAIVWRVTRPRKGTSA